MRVEDAQRVVDLAEVRDPPAHDIHAEPWDGATRKPNGDGAPASDNSRAGSDGYQPGDHALHGANYRRLLKVDHVAGGPAQQRHGRADVGVEHGDAGICGRRVGVPAVEAVPA